MVPTRSAGRVATKKQRNFLAFVHLAQMVANVLEGYTGKMQTARRWRWTQSAANRSQPDFPAIRENTGNFANPSRKLRANRRLALQNSPISCATFIFQAGNFKSGSREPPTVSRECIRSEGHKFESCRVRHRFALDHALPSFALSPRLARLAAIEREVHFMSRYFSFLISPVASTVHGPPLSEIAAWYV